MTINAKLGLTIGLLATALLAACGGGGGGTAITPAKSAGNSGGGTTTQSSTGPHLTFSFNRSKPGKSAAASKRRGTTAVRSPKYFSDDSYGMQITVTSGTATQTIYADLRSNGVLCSEDPTTSIETCSISIPTLGAMESVSALEVNLPPSNENTSTGLGTAFPSNSTVLAVGTTTATLAAGQNTAISLSMNPVVSQIADSCGYGADPVGYDNNMNFDSYDGRIVVTANVASSAVAATSLADASNDFIVPNIDQASASPTVQGQPFVDVNGSPTPVTLVSSASNVTVAVGPGGYGFPSPAPSPSLAQSVSIPTSASLYTGYDDCGNLLVTFAYVPGPSPSPSTAPATSTVVLSANRTAAAPVFTGLPVSSCCGSNTVNTSFTFTVTPISASPATLSLTFGGQAGTVTGYDPGAGTSGCCDGGGMNASAPPPFVSGTSGPYQTTVQPSSTSSCTDSAGNTIASISPNGYSGVSETFAVTPAASPPSGITGTDTCTIVLYDVRTSVITNPVTVSIAQPA